MRPDAVGLSRVSLGIGFHDLLIGGAVLDVKVLGLVG